MLYHDDVSKAQVSIVDAKEKQVGVVERKGGARRRHQTIRKNDENAKVGTVMKIKQTSEKTSTKLPEYEKEEEVEDGTDIQN